MKIIKPEGILEILHDTKTNLYSIYIDDRGDGGYISTFTKKDISKISKYLYDCVHKDSINHSSLNTDIFCTRKYYNL